MGGALFNVCNHQSRMTAKPAQQSGPRQRRDDGFEQSPGAGSEQSRGVRPAHSRGAPLTQQTLDEGAQRLTGVAVVVAVAVVTWLLLQQLAQPHSAAILSDPVNRLGALFVVLMAGGVVALQRYGVVTSRTVLRLGMAFEIVAAISIAMVETSRPFDGTTRLVGLSAIGPLILFAGAAMPTQPPVRLALALAAATAWPIVYWINSTRFDFVTEWRQAFIWPLMNYLFAGLAFVVGRRLYGGTVQETEEAQDLGSYKLLWQIGEGGMGDVWRASHKMLARPAAIKLVKLDAGRQDLFALRFHREANAISALQSPHTVYLYDFGTTEQGRLYYVMELLDGISLQTLVTAFGAQTPSRVIAILKQACRSLEEAHEKKIVHRDLKPSNLMICQVAQVFDFVKVLDFGLAKPFGRAAEASNLTVEGVTVGTPEYMAPEVARSSRKIDARADLYALGCVAYFLLTGTLVFPEANAVSAALKHMSAAPDPPSRRTDRFIPPDLEHIVLQCLEKDPAARPASARELERMLALCDLPPWTEEDAATWWAANLPPTSPLRSSSQTSQHAPAAVRKA
jgi:serine/threonine-protein kinase